MNGVEIKLDAQWITVEGLNLSLIMIPRKDALALARGIRKVLGDERRLEMEEKQQERTVRREELQQKRKRKKQSAAERLRAKEERKVKKARLAVERLVHREQMKQPYFSTRVRSLLNSMTKEQKRLAVAAHKKHVAACQSLGEAPESLIKFLEEWSKPEQVRSEEWTPQTIGEGLCRQRYWQYASGRREQAA